ncbi:hypothetical protein AgCh_006967 [Apium graveolens]
MSSAVLSLPVKRIDLYANDDSMPPEKRAKKMGDSAMELQLIADTYDAHCMICGCNTDHDQFGCPERPKMMAMACAVCLQPCVIKEHQDMPEIRKLIFCARCDVIGDHWSDDCPDPIFDECDFF